MQTWGGNYTYRAARVHRPATVDEVQEIVSAAERIRVLGSRHSFSDIADSRELLCLDALPSEIAVDHAAGTVSLAGGVTYGELAAALRPQGVALANMASLPHISVAGAVATATHGSGETNGNLATAVAAVELVTSGGDIVTTARGDHGFDGVVVGLGALGAVTRLTLDVEPAYEVRQRVFEDLDWSALFGHFDEIAASGYSVSVFTTLREAVDQVWVKSRGTERGDLFGARAATAELHPVPGMDPINCTSQLGRNGAWSDRLPHFRMDFTPSSGAEIQSEYHVPRRHGLAAIEAVRGLADVIRAVLQVCEIRTIAADRLWMSPQYERDTVALHFTWRLDPQGVARAAAALEVALAPFEARPHWGKLFLADAATIARLYPRLPDFAELVARLDPRQVFRNAWLERHVLGTA